MIELTDFHSHILPSMDDGSSSVQESVEMLRLSYQGGVRRMVATPHFYAQKESPARFLARRSEAWDRLAPALPEDTPRLYLGAEVCYYAGVSQTESLPELCIEGSNLLLLEMPFQKWTGRVTGEVIQIAQERGIRVLLAHIDRYLAFQSPDTWERLAASGVLFQVNASAFLGGWSSRRRVCKLLREGEIAALGSDCHNMKNRKPNLSDAFAVIQKKIGQEAVCMMTERADYLLTSGRIAVKP
ncbi:MAG: hypothetical protein LIO95_00965 [Clostridiales bacterium]|nr:hypothetical protein [Clostridiales bacterium]